MKCQAIIGSGEQCKREAEEDSKYCWQHQRGAEKNGGRPRKYDKEFIENLADDMIEWFEGNSDNLFLEEFMTQQGLHSEYVSRFKRRSDYFRQALKRVKDIQKTRLIRGGLTGDYDRTMAIFTLKNVSDMRDKQTKEITGKDGGPVEHRHDVDLSQLSNEELRRLDSISRKLSSSGENKS